MALLLWFQGPSPACLIRPVNSGFGREIQEDSGTSSSPVGHPAQHRRNPEDFQAGEIEREHWGVWLWAVRGRYGNNQEHRQGVSHQSTCQILGHQPLRLSSCRFACISSVLCPASMSSRVIMKVNIYLERRTEKYQSKHETHAVAMLFSRYSGCWGLEGDNCSHLFRLCFLSFSCDLKVKR